MNCTGVSAFWCPRCGDCTCERLPDGDCCFDGRYCPLHGHSSRHAETITPREVERALEQLVDGCEAELSADDQAELKRFAQILFERSRKEKVLQ